MKYHSYENHIKPMLLKIENDIHLNGIGGEDKKTILKLAAVFHDIVYVPGRSDNEDNSVTYLKMCYDKQEFILPALVMTSWGHFVQREILSDAYEDNFIQWGFKNITPEIIDKVVELIKNTKDTFDRRLGDELGHYFYLLDTFILRCSYNDLIQYEHGIYNEYRYSCTLEEYKKGRTDFLLKCKNEIQSVNEAGIDALIKYVNERDYGSVGIFCGSFNPFHIGHLNVLEQALGDFNNVIIVQMQDFNKPENKYDLPKKLSSMDIGGYPGYECLAVKSSDTLVDVYKKYSEGYRSATIIRALRNGDDLQHEQNLKLTVHDFNKNVRFTYYLADEGFSHISSSLVRSLPENLQKKYLVK